MAQEINITAWMVFDDDKNEYAITFAWEGKIFISAIYDPKETDNDQKFQILPRREKMCFIWFADVFFYLKLAATVKSEKDRLENISRKAHEKLFENREGMFRVFPTVFHKYDASLVFTGHEYGIHLPVPVSGCRCSGGGGN